MSQTEVIKNQSCTHNNLETPLKYLIPFNPQIFQEQSATYMHQIKEKPGFQMLPDTCPLEYTHSRQKLLKHLQGTKTKVTLYFSNANQVVLYLTNIYTLSKNIMVFLG